MVQLYLHLKAWVVPFLYAAFTYHENRRWLASPPRDGDGTYRTRFGIGVRTSRRSVLWWPWRVDMRRLSSGKRTGLVQR